MDPAPTSCPRCRKVPLDDQPLVRHCSRCKGSWISEEVLHARVEAERGARPGLRWHREARAVLFCAVCAEPMEALVVKDTAVDRCPRHGVWFDKGELAHVLAPVAPVAAVASVAAADPARDSIAADLVEDGVELAIESGVELAVEAAEAGDVAVGAADVVDGAADVVMGAGEVADAGGGVFEVVIGGIGFVAETVVDVVAGILSTLD